MFVQFPDYAIDFHLEPVLPDALCRVLSKRWAKVYVHLQYPGRLSRFELSLVLDAELAIQCVANTPTTSSEFNERLTEMYEYLAGLATYGWYFYQADISGDLHILLQRNPPDPLAPARLCIMSEQSPKIFEKPSSSYGPDTDLRCLGSSWRLKWEKFISRKNNKLTGVFREISSFEMSPAPILGK